MTALVVRLNFFFRRLFHLLLNIVLLFDVLRLLFQLIVIILEILQLLLISILSDWSELLR